MAGNPIKRQRAIAQVLGDIEHGSTLAQALSRAKIDTGKWHMWAEHDGSLQNRVARARIAAAEHIMLEAQGITDTPRQDHSDVPAWELGDRKLRSEARMSRARVLLEAAQRGLDKAERLATVNVDARSVHVTAALTMSDAQLAELLASVRPDLLPGSGHEPALIEHDSD